MNFSIVFPTRNRVDLFADLCKSIDDTTADKNNIEVLVGYDHDDGNTARLVPSLMHTYPWLHCHARHRSSHITRDYHNWLYRQSHGRFIIICNDDVVFRTQHWDQIALNKLNSYLADKPDGIVYGWLSDSLVNRAGGQGYCCFPLVSRAAADTVGYVMHDFYQGWNADIHLYNLYSSIGRILDLSEIWLDHISYHTGKRGRDETSFNMQNISNNGSVDMNVDQRKFFARIAGAPAPPTPQPQPPTPPRVYTVVNDQPPTPYITQIGVRHLPIFDIDTLKVRLGIFG